MLPKRTEFFELLAAHSERVLAGANAMLRLITSLGVSQADVAALVQEINMNEASADQIKADLMTMLHKSFVTPLNRDQVYALTLDIDRVMNALDKALRKALVGAYPALADIRLTDYKVRILDSESATGAGVRVLIHTENGCRRWSTPTASRSAT